MIGPKELVADLFTYGFLGPRPRLLKFRGVGELELFSGAP